MKTFRCPFGKSNAIFEVKVFAIFFTLLGIPVFLSTEFNVPGFLFLVIFLLCIVHILISRFFYVILTDDELIIKNGIYPFWKKETRYVDIVKVRIKWYGDKSDPCMRVFTKKSSIFFWQYTIDLINPRDYAALIEAIKTKGVTVETEGIERYVNIFRDKNIK